MCFSCWFGGLSVSRAVLAARACERGSSGSTVLNLRHPSDAVGSRVTRRDESPVRECQVQVYGRHNVKPQKGVLSFSSTPMSLGPRCQCRQVQSVSCLGRSCAPLYSIYFKYNPLRARRDAYRDNRSNTQQLTQTSNQVTACLLRPRPARPRTPLFPEA